MAVYPENYSYRSSGQTLHWDGVSGSQEYQVEYTTNPQDTNWPIAYNQGTALSCSFIQSPNTYAIRGKSKKDGYWSSYCPIEYVEVTT